MNNHTAKMVAAERGLKTVRDDADMMCYFEQQNGDVVLELSYVQLRNMTSEGLRRALNHATNKQETGDENQKDGDPAFAQG